MSMTFVKRTSVAVLSAAALIAGGLPLASIASAAPATAPLAPACETADFAAGDSIVCLLPPGATVKFTLRGPDGSRGGAGGAGGNGGLGWTGSAVTQGGIGGQGGRGGAGGLGAKGVVTYKNTRNESVPVSINAGDAAAPAINGLPGTAGLNALNFGPAAAGGSGSNGQSGVDGHQGQGTAVIIGLLDDPYCVVVQADGGTGGRGGAFGTGAGGGPSTSGTGASGRKGADGAPGTRGRISVQGLYPDLVTVEKLAATSGEPASASMVVSSSWMKIRGSRGQDDNAGTIAVLGRSEGLEGKKGTVRLRLAGDDSYSDAGKVTIGADGTFTWSKVTNRKAYVRVVFADGRSNRVIIPAGS